MPKKKPTKIKVVIFMNVAYALTSMKCVWNQKMGWLFIHSNIYLKYEEEKKTIELEFLINY